MIACQKERYRCILKVADAKKLKKDKISQTQMLIEFIA